MLSLANIRSTAAAAIAASSYVAQAPAVSVIVDDGLQDAAINAQLNTRGCVVVLPPILRCARRDIGGGRMLLDAEMLVRVILNPEANVQAGAANRAIYPLISAVAQAVLQWAPPAGDRRFETSEEFIQLVTNDPGLIAYDLSFAKLTNL